MIAFILALSIVDYYHTTRRRYGDWPTGGLRSLLPPYGLDRRPYHTLDGGGRTTRGWHYTHRIGAIFRLHLEQGVDVWVVALTLLLFMVLVVVGALGWLAVAYLL